MQATARTKQIARLRKEFPDAGATLPFKRESPLVDAAFTSRHAEVHIRTGPLDNSVNASVDLHIEDGHTQVNVYWEMERVQVVKGEYTFLKDHPYPHTDMTFGVDEIEAWATALYQAVQLAKKQGYLPGGSQS
jgi:hypothetical protein